MNIKETIKSEISAIEAELANPVTSNERRRLLEIKLNSLKVRLTFMDAPEREIIEREMKYFLSNIKDIDEKYKCRTVKALFGISEWFEKPRSAKLSNWFKDIAMKKIHAPVCSIGNKKETVLKPKFED